MNDAYISDALNALDYDEHLDLYTGQIEIGRTACARGVPIKLRLYTDADDDLEPTLRRAREVLAEFDTYSRRAEEYVVQELLPLKNDIWLDEDEETPLTPQQFKQRMALESLVFYAEGDVTFYYQDGDLFWGHIIELWMDAADNFIGAHISG